ncbi:MAG: hypothetical protein M3Q28_00350 [Pseudomonadota bacterium]|nr:hypothetical protein [Pseudomonadota bacterium]
MNRLAPPASISAALSSPLLIAGLLSLIALAGWWSNIYEVDAFLALKGFSPIAWVYQTAHPGNFSLDFPSGAENYRFSAFMHVYLAAYQLGISPETFLRVVVAFEIVLLSSALFALYRVLAPDAPLVVLALVIVFAIASTARDLNLALWTQPFFTGQYYNVAEALRILGIVMVLKRRPLPAAALFAGAFVTHPTMALMGVACAVAMQLVRPRDMLKREFLAAAALFLVIAGGWLFVQFGATTISTGQMPLSDWMEMTRMFNGHFYTVHFGLFTINAKEVFLPFLSFLLLLVYYFPAKAERSETSTKVLAAILALLGLVVCGLAISVFVAVPFLIKLALHRANDLVLLLGLVYVVAGLWREVTADAWWRRALAATILLSPWFVRPFPLLLSVVLVAPAWLRVFGRRRPSLADRTIAALVLGAALATGYYFAAGIWTGLNPLNFFHERQRLWLLALFLVISALCARRFGRQSGQVLVLAAAIALALGWLKDQADNKADARARDYLDAQVWAREHTPNSALFMTDPSIYYGWRDYSRRSSFGNAREWLHHSWLYDSNFERYQEGMRRFGEFNIDLRPYLRSEPVMAANNRLRYETRRRYYEASDEWRIDLARRHNIDFFVFERAHMVRPTGLKVVYQNDRFVICAASG